MTLPHTLALADSRGRHARASRDVAWTVPGATTLRLHQLLAQAGYLPVKWTPDGADVAHTARAEAGAAAVPPAGHFSWRYPNTPPELKSQWDDKNATVITRGAVMMYQDEHHMTVDGIAGPSLWKALMADAIKGAKPHPGYSYVYVHENVPQKMTLWHDGGVVITSPGNTGIASAPTALGTFPVFEHLAVTTMSGTNPDGSHYTDPGIKWVSYFNGGDALHAFDRASFGTPQSVGCVELPLASAAKIWPYTPIGTLVTIES
jgi:peptidoglycan hydrolase-like protein with peptidoglycan-binding domain